MNGSTGNQRKDMDASKEHHASDTLALLLEKGAINQSTHVAATNLKSHKDDTTADHVHGERASSKDSQINNGNATGEESASHGGKVASPGIANKAIGRDSLRGSTYSMGSSSLHAVECYAINESEEDEKKSGDVEQDSQHPQSMMKRSSKTETISPPTLRRNAHGLINRTSAGPGAFSVPGTGSSREIDVSCHEPHPAAAPDGNTDGPMAQEEDSMSTLPVHLPDEAFSIDEASLVKSGHLSMIDLEEATNVQALPSSREHHSRKRSHDIMCGLTLLLVLAGGIIVITVLLTGGADEVEGESKHGATTEEGLTAPTLAGPIIYPPFDTDLPPETLKEISSGDPDSPRYKANLWVREDKNLEDYPNWRKHQRFNMAVIYHSTEGDNWFQNDQWLSYEVDECSWYSRNPQPCNEKGELVVQDLQANNLGGTLPMEIQMSWTKHADYSHNNLSGGLPRITHDNKFEVIILSNNSFSPNPVISDAGYDGSMRKVLKLDSNWDLVFPSMAWLHTYPNLEVLNLTGNAIAGALPSVELESTPHLTYLGLGNNLYSGAVPSELGLLTKLTGLDLSGNPAVGGPLPTELARLTALKDLDVSGTSVNGTIPIEICSRSNLTLHATCDGLLQCC